MMRVEQAKLFADPGVPYSIERYVFKEQETIPSHTHDFFELLYVVDGVFNHVYNGKSSPLRAGDICLIEPGVYHSCPEPVSETVTVYYIRFLSDRLPADSLSSLPREAFSPLSFVTPIINSRPGPLCLHTLSG